MSAARPPAAALLSVSGLTLAFGGVKALDGVGFDGRARLDHLADRPERRRQDVGLQRDLGLLPADQRPHLEFEGGDIAGPAAAAARGARPGAHASRTSRCSAA